MLEIILIRHGETDSNKNKRFLGWTDTPLNTNGIKQSYKVKQKFKGEKLDAIYSSPLKRCVETARIINEPHNIEISYSNELRERNFGIWENLTYHEIAEKFPKEYSMMADDWENFVIESGESAFEAHERVKEFIDCITKKHKEGRIAIVTHSGPVKTIVTHLLAMKLEDVWRFRIENCGIARIEINNDGYAYLTMMNG